MSLGHVKTEGDKGNNYPWQFAVVDQLVRIKDALVSGVITVTGSFVASSTQRTTSRTTVGISSGTIAAGAKWISIETSDDFVGTIEGTTANASRFYNYAALQNDDYYNAIAYVVTAGSIVIGKAV